MNVTLAIEVDPAEWAATYGLELADVRSDIRDYVLNLVQQSVGVLESGARVKLK